MRLQKYDFTVVYNRGTTMYFADARSRVHSVQESNKLFEQDMTIAALDINVKNKHLCTAKATVTYNTVTQIQ